MFKIGIDLGYGFFKGVNEVDKNLVFPSLISLGYDRSLAGIFGTGIFNTDKNMLNNLHVSIAEGDNKSSILQKEYFVGELARKQQVNSSYNLSDNKIYDDDTKVLLATGVAMLLPDTDAPIHLSTGLPLEQYKHQKQEFEEMLKKFSCIVTFKELNLTKVIKFDKVTTFIQGGGAAYHSILDNAEKYLIKNTYIGLIDPGEKTTNYLVFYVTPNGKLNFEIEMSGTIDIGMSRIKVAMERLYSDSNQGKKLDIEQITALCKTGSIFTNGHFVDMTKDLDNVKSEIARAIKNKVLSVWNSKIDMFSTVFAAGGGSIELFDYLKSMHNNVVLSKDAQMANARGYLKVAQMTELAEKRNGVA